MKKYEVTLTFMDNETKRRAVITVNASSTTEAIDNIMYGLKQQGATNITVVTNREVK